jgi:hypothetical protein
MSPQAGISQHFTAAVVASGREVTVELAVAIGKAAELVALAEDMRARALRGVDVNADDLVRMQRLADASVRRLNLPSAICTLTSDYRSLRGWMLLLAIMDEASFLRGRAIIDAGC